MGIFYDLFTPLEIKNRDQLQLMKLELESQPIALEAMQKLGAQVDRLELVCRALTELIVAKGVATRSELSVVLQQLDLEDGVEDGRARSEVRHGAPRCAGCDRFINPQRDRCVYCGASVAGAGGEPYRDKRAAVRAPAVKVQCVRCEKSVPEADTLFTADGLVCPGCYDHATD